MQTNKLVLERFVLLFIPWGFSLLFRNVPLLSYFIAWSGSFFIFFITLTGWVKPLPDDRSFANQMMRPIILVQIIFAGYMCCTTIFFLLNIYGYENFEKTTSFFLIDPNKIFLLAQCQRYYVLGHAAFVSGILIFMKYPKKQKYKSVNISNLLFVFAIVSFPLAVVFLKIPGLSQFANQFNAICFVASTLALAFAIPEKKVLNTCVCLLLYFSNFYTALTSGFKEPIILSILILGIFLYPAYKKIVLLVFPPVLLVLFILLPTYARIFRQNAWFGDVSADAATELAVNAALNDTSENDDDNWAFFVYRLSEVDMFITFIQSTPQKIGFYNFELLKQSAIVIVPRIFWPSKPVTEDLVMERVYNAGVIYRGSRVSAKPAFIVDAYLSGGTLGIIISLFIYGAAAQLLSQKAEQLFGGYVLGTALIFSGLFQSFWRGLSFEFIINVVFWSYISMLVIHKILILSKILKKV